MTSIRRVRKSFKRKHGIKTVSIRIKYKKQFIPSIFSNASEEIKKSIY